MLILRDLVDVSTVKSNMNNMRLYNIHPGKFAQSFAARIRNVAETLAAISGLQDSIRTLSDPSNIETIAIHVARYAKREEMMDDRTESSIGMLARVAYNRITDIDLEPNYDAILKSAFRFAPQSDIDAVVIGARARLCIDQNARVPVAWLAVFAGVSYDNCTMNVHRGKLKGSRGMVTATSARVWLEKRDA